MGLLDNIFGKLKSSGAGPYGGMTVSFPYYYQGNKLESVWDSDLPWQCIERIKMEVARCQPCHILRTASSVQVIEDDITRVFRNPNPLQSTFDMLCRIIHMLYTRDNAWVYPIYEGNQLDGLYPLDVMEVDFINRGGELWVRLHFANGEKHEIPYLSVIHMRINYGEDEWVGQGKTKPLLSNISINENLLHGIEKALDFSTTINGVVQFGSLHARDRMEKEVAAFEASLRKSESKLLSLDNQSTFQKIQKDVKLIDKETLAFVQGLVTSHFNTPEHIINGTATKEQRSVWYEAAIVPLLENIGQAFSNILFSATRRNKGHAVRLYNKNRLEWMTGTDLNAAIDQLTNVGALSINQILEAYGYPPIGEEGNIRPMSLNYIDAKVATQYQLETQKKEVPKEGKENEE